MDLKSRGRRQRGRRRLGRGHRRGRSARAGGSAGRWLGFNGKADEGDVAARGSLAGGAGVGEFFEDGVPLAAGFAAPGPFRAGGAAGLADEAGGGFGYGDRKVHGGGESEQLAVAPRFQSGFSFLPGRCGEAVWTAGFGRERLVRYGLSECQSRHSWTLAPRQMSTQAGHKRSKRPIRRTDIVRWEREIGYLAEISCE